MAVISKFAGTVSQTTGGHYVTFSDLGNIRNSTSESHAVSNVLIQGKSESKNRPSSISCTNFKFNLPTGAEPVKVKVVYRYRKNAGSDYSSKHPKRICNIPAPTVSLLGVSGFSGKGVSATTTMTTHTKTFNVSGKMTRAQVNSNSFGVKINWPTNTNKWNGYLRVSYVRLEVTYKVSSYSVSLKKQSGGYNNEDYTLELSISNKNGTSYNPRLTLSSPVGFSFKSSKGTGSLVQDSARSFTWDPKLGSNVSTSSINVVFTPSVIYPSGQSSYSGVFTLSESLNGVNTSHTAVITERPVTSDETAPDTQVIPMEKEVDTSIHFIRRDEVATIPIRLTQEETEWLREDETRYYHFELYDNPSYGDTYTTFYPYVVRVLSDGNWRTTSSVELVSDCVLDDGTVTYLLRDRRDPTSQLDTVMKLIPYIEYLTELALVMIRGRGGGEVRKVKINLIPSDLTIPNFTVLEPAEEELDRLGSGYTYICQSDIKHTTTDTFSRDWYKNNRIGVFNNAISDNITITTETDPDTGEVTETITDTTDYENLTPNQIIENAEYWSNAPTIVNEYNNLECEFTYNENYPLYLIFTGDYPETTSYGYDMGSVTYNNPSITEKTVYKEREPTGNYPVPITGLLPETETTGELTIPVLNTSTPVILYDLELEEGYGNTDTLHIRGIEVRGNIEQTDELILYAKLTSSTGLTGQRSIKLNEQDTTIDSDNEFKLGGLGDLWGFPQKEMHDLDDWEIELSFSNLLEDTEANINFGDVQIIFYVQTIEKQLINVKINDEDLSFYGAFVEDVKIPEGLETDTDYLTIDGTDTNDAYRQNIKEKTIELDLSIGECDLETSTVMLRQLTQLIVNDKDEYNRPIPNTIEFSHYPDVYWEYILEDALDVDTNAGAYTIKAKLTVPSGTSYTRNTITTNITGYVRGLASISPVITIKPQAEEITLTETVTGQEFSIDYTGGWNDGILEINCEDRKAYMKTNEDDTYPVDLSKYVDFNSDWFTLKGEYSFSCAGGVVRTVEYVERW